MPLIDVLTPLALFMALVLAVSLHGLAASGHFPRGQRKSTVASGFGSVLLFGSIALVVVCFVAGIAAAAQSLECGGYVVVKRQCCPHHQDINFLMS